MSQSVLFPDVSDSAPSVSLLFSWLAVFRIFFPSPAHTSPRLATLCGGVEPSPDPPAPCPPCFNPYFSQSCG